MRRIYHARYGLEARSQKARNIQRARDDGHPEAVWLPRLADVINDRAPLSSPDAWPAWRESTASDSA